jgi:hypothetical protein
MLTLKNEIVAPKGFRFCFATTYQQTLGRKELKDGTFQVFVSHFNAWLPHARI